MSAKHTHTPPSVRRIQTLSHSHVVRSLVIRIVSNKSVNCNALKSSVVLIVGDHSGRISLYTSPLSPTQPLHFTLRKRFQAHANGGIMGLHLHYHKSLCVSHYRKDVKVWNFEDIAAPRLIHCLPQGSWVVSVKYSESGLLLTACVSSYNSVLHVYGKEPQFSLCWSYKIAGQVFSMAWSPSNRIGAVLHTGDSYAVQIWDSSFQTICKLKQDNICALDNALVFASNDLLMYSGGDSNKVYWYHISKPKVMKVFLDTGVLPFCRDVLKIIRQYLPLVTRVTHNKLPDNVGRVVSLSSEVVGAQCRDDKLHLYKVDVNEPRLLAALPLPHHFWAPLATCVYPCSSGKETLFILASILQGFFNAKHVIVSVTASEV